MLVVANARFTHSWGVSHKVSILLRAPTSIAAVARPPEVRRFGDAVADGLNVLPHIQFKKMSGLAPGQALLHFF